MQNQEVKSILQFLDEKYTRMEREVNFYKKKIIELHEKNSLLRYKLQEYGEKKINNGCSPEDVYVLRQQKSWPETAKILNISESQAKLLLKKYELPKGEKNA